jgi:type IV secretion system protein VirB5
MVAKISFRSLPNGIDQQLRQEVSMRSLKVQAVLACVLGLTAMVQPARAQWAVIDAPAIVQLIQQVEDAEQILSTARNQLSQAQQALQSMTGARGMEQLLSGTVRNYLPSNWTQVSAAAVSADTQSIVASNAILSARQLSSLPPAVQQLIQGSRQWTGLQQAMSRQALSNASSRFSSLQTLISTIPSASDQKGILDLQARISAELGMLQNEQTKLQVLNQATQAQAAALQQQAREQVINGHGRFDTRFRPTL